MYKRQGPGGVVPGGGYGESDGIFENGAAVSIDAGRARRIAGEPGIGKIPAAGNLVLNAMGRRRSLRGIVGDARVAG